MREIKIPFAVIFGVFLFRIFNSFTIRTYFDPDEYWQSLEVAHHQVFGYGYLTWEWSHRIRSCLYLLPFILYFKILSVLEIDTPTLVIYGPKFLQAISAGFVDLLVFKLALKHTNNYHRAYTALLLNLSCWFNFAYATRTISNNLESLLVLLAMTNHLSSKRSLIFAGLSIINRPSAITHWIIPHMLGTFKVVRSYKTKRFISDLILSIFIVVSFGMFLDGYYYGNPLIFTWFRFFKVNILEGISSFYGKNPWHFYITSLILPTTLPFLPIVYFKRMKWSTLLMSFMAGSVLINSLIPHKEFRFLAPLVPLLSVLIADVIRLNSNFTRCYIGIVMAINLMIGGYLAIWHQAGVISLITHLQGEIDHEKVKGSIFFAMPCHSTPFYGYLHRNIPMRFIHCEPFQSPSEDEIFYKDPWFFLDQEFIHNNYSRVAMFDELLGRDRVGDVLEKYGFCECARFFHAHLIVDGRRSKEVVLFCQLKNQLSNVDGN